MGLYEDEQVWQKNWDRSTKRLLSLYKEAFTDILNELLQVAGKDISELTVKEETAILAQIARRLEELEEENKKWVKEEITKAFIVGQASSLTQLGYAASLEQAMKQVTTSAYSKRTLEAIMADTFNDLLYATQNTNKRTKKLVKDTFSMAFRQKRIQNTGRRELTKEISQTLSKQFIKEQLRNDGFVGIVDSANRKWTLNNYVKMATQTKIQDTFRQGVVFEAIERGHDLAYISDHNAKDACSKFEGLVISLTGQTEGYPSLDDIKGHFGSDIFHPFCKHKIRTVRHEGLIPQNIKNKNEVNRKNVSRII